MARWLARDAERRLRREFAAVRVHGLSRARDTVARGPVLFVANHTAWWDPLVLQYLSERVLGVDAFAMMDAKNLVRFPFFRKVGAFGVDLEDPRDGTRAIRYAAKLLDGPRRVVWIFPQGRERPVTARPLGFRAGSVHVARVAGRATVIPMALRYEFGGGPAPQVWISLGDAIVQPERRDVAVDAHEVAVEREMDRVERAVQGDLGHDTFEPLFERAPGALFVAAQRALAWLTRGGLGG